MKIAIYAGSFDPPTMGHLSVVQKVYQLFDKLIVLIADNPDKKTVFSKEERIELFNCYLEDMSTVSCISCDNIWPTN